MNELTEDDKKALVIARTQGRLLIEEADAFVVIGMVGDDVRSLRGCRDGAQTLAIIGAMELCKAQIHTQTLGNSMGKKAN